VAEFGDGVNSKSVLQVGQSNDPDLPHYDDRGSLYVQQRFRNVASNRADVELRAEERYSADTRSK